MTDYSELKRLAEAFPADLDWDSNTEPFFNGPSGESLGGGATGFYCVYGKPFRLEGEDYDYDGPTYVEACPADFAKFMVAAREGVLSLIAENEKLKVDLREVKDAKLGLSWAIGKIMGERDQLKTENERERKDWQAECLKKGFDYVRESDDHYVLADVPEMAALLGELLGVEVRDKDNHAYGETVSSLNEQIDAANNAFHRAYELEKEVEALRKDLESHKRMLLAAACDVGAIGKALKADMNADGDELYGMAVDLKAQNTRMMEWLKEISRTSGDKGAVMGARQLLKEFGQ